MRTLRLLATVVVCWTPALLAQDASLRLQTRVDSIFSAQVRAPGPGCAVGVYQNGELVLARGYGSANTETGTPITPQTTFNLGSASKPFTALAVLTLEERGELSLDDDVRRYVPELPAYDAPIRIRDLLQHTSGLRDYGAMGVLAGRQVATMQEFTDLLAAQRSLNFTPGTRHEYSHSDFGVLAIVVERVTGEPFGAWLEREVLAPLGMTSSRVHNARGAGVLHRAYGHDRAGDDLRMLFPDSEITGGDNLYTSVEDLQRWDRALDEAAAGRRPLVARLLQRPTLSGGDTIPYAFGIRKGTHRGVPAFSRVGHSNGMWAEFIRLPDQRYGMAVLCNGDHFVIGRMNEGVADLFLSGRLQPVDHTIAAPAPVAAPAAELAEYVGVYRLAGGVEPSSDFTPGELTRFALSDGRLGEVLLGGDTIQAMTYHGSGRFTFDGSPSGFQVQFKPGSSPGPMRAEFSWNGAVQSVMERVDRSSLWLPDSAALAEYAGRYHSGELDATWELLPRDGTLVVRRRGSRDASLTAEGPNLFTRPFGPWESLIPTRLEFGRDPSGKVAGFTVSTSGDGQIVRGVRFVRLSNDP